MSGTASVKDRLEERIMSHRDKEIRYWENEAALYQSRLSKFGLVSSQMYQRFWETVFHPIRCFKEDLGYYRGSAPMAERQKR